MSGLLEDQIEEAQAAFLAAHDAGDKEGAQVLADHIRDLQTQKTEIDQVMAESSREGTNLRNPLTAAGVGALAGATVNPIRSAVGNIAAPPKVNAPAPSSLSGQVGQGGENWTKSLTGVDVPNAQMNKGSLDTAQRMAATVAPGGELAGGKITPGGIMVGPEIGAKPAAPAPIIPRTAAQAKQTGKSLIQGFAGEPHPTTPFSIVKGGTRGAITGGALADIPQQLSQGNYGTAASDLGIATGNIVHGLSKTPKGKAIGTLLGLGSGVLRGKQGIDEVMSTPEQKANGGLIYLAAGGQPEFGTAQAYEPSYSEKIRDFAAKHVGRDYANRWFGGPNARFEDNFNPFAMALQTPGVIADSAAGFVKAGQEGDYLGGMGHYLTGALNVAPMLKPGGKFVKAIMPKMAGGGDVLKAGAELAKKALASKPQKFSEAIEPFIGTHSLHPTIVDKTKLDLAANRMAGPEAPYLQEISQPHKESGWIFANDSLGAANKLYNMGKSGNTLVTGLLGSPTQLKTNRSVFGEIADEYFKAIKEGKMSPELQAKIQARLPTLRHGKENIQTFPQEFDIRDRDAFNEMAKGFHQRGHLADIMGGKGVSQGLPRGTGKIIPYEEILMRNTEESLQGAPTHSVGSRLFTVGSKPPEYRPDLHNAFDYANFGELKSGNFGWAPKEVAYPDEINRIKANLASRGIGRDITAMDLMRNTINQPITEQMWRRAQDAGFATGGLVHLAGGGKIPEAVVKAYKLFRTKGGNTDELYPLFVNANKPVPIGEWVPAEVGPVAASGKVKSKLGELAYRPGWHAGDLPIATHIGGKSDPKLKAPDFRRADEVWAEVEMPNDVDWQTIANQKAQLNKAGQPIPRTAHITDEVPFGGFYRYKTSPNMQGNWLIGGDMKVNRVLTDEEVRAINEAAGAADLPRFTPIK